MRRISAVFVNPNDLALTLNLIIPFAGALIALSRGVVARSVAAGALDPERDDGDYHVLAGRALTLSAIAILSMIFFVKRRAPAVAATMVAATLTIVPLCLPATWSG